MLPQTNDVHPYKGDIEQISKGYDVLVDEIFDDDVVLVAFVGKMLLVFCEFFGHRTENLLVEYVGD